MPSDVIPAASTPFGQRVRDRLASARVIWLTTVAADGTPQPNPVWFLWDGEDSILLYNRDGAARLANVRARPRVSLNLDSDGTGGDIIVLVGDAELTDDYPPATANPAYLAKYEEQAKRLFGDSAAFARQYSAAVRIRITKVRGM
jgi:PPOX class probable F420-dependent enzyme